MRTLLAASAWAAITATTALADNAGYTSMSFDAPHHGRGVVGAIWYPAADDGRSFTFAENPVFHGVTVVEEASVLDGPHPVILLSHGMGGNIRSLAWLASGLAEQGSIVISVNHPNSTWGDFDLAEGLKHWTRAQDLSLALDTLMADPKFAGHIDSNRIMAAGFSYGGWTALSLGGLKGNHASFVAHCEEFGERSSYCAELLRSDIGLADMPAMEWNADISDARLSHVVAIEPGLIWGVEAGDLDGLVENVSLIGLGEGDDRLLGTDFDASGFADLLPGAGIDRIVPALHFTALPLCKPMGAAILLEEQDDPVCTDPEGTDRDHVHDLIIGRIASDLGL